ncbi:MAG: Holliday junction resolvase RuvX [Spirochaetota bacterium]|nr:MAG: Holliday junction resolvase RuvX [Spirochaetota bacterium]
MSFIAGIDVGEVRIGIAISDSEKRIAFPLGVIKRERGSYGLRRIERILEDREVELFVVGLPKRSDGVVGKEEKKVFDFVEGLKKYFNKDVVTWDERYTTVIAQQALQEGLSHSGISRANKRKKNIDKIAAQIILQSYLDYINNQ